MEILYLGGWSSASAERMSCVNAELQSESRKVIEFLGDEQLELY